MGIESEVSTKVGTFDLVVVALVHVCDGTFDDSFSVRNTCDAQMLLSQNVLNDRCDDDGDADDICSPLRSSASIVAGDGGGSACLVEWDVTFGLATGSFVVISSFVAWPPTFSRMCVVSRAIAFMAESSKPYLCLIGGACGGFFARLSTDAFDSRRNGCARNFLNDSTLVFLFSANFECSAESNAAPCAPNRLACSKSIDSMAVPRRP